MKVLITSTENSINANFDLRFGRANWFCVLDTETKDVEFYENKHKDAPSGAGTKAAEMVAELEVKKVISGDFGPKAKDVLNQLAIQMVILDEQGSTIEQIINKLN